MRLCCNLLGAMIARLSGRLDLRDTDLGVTPSVAALSVAANRERADALRAK